MAQVVAADTDADLPWLVTAYIPGLSLREATFAATVHSPFGAGRPMVVTYRIVHSASRPDRTARRPRRPPHRLPGQGPG